MAASTGRLSLNAFGEYLVGGPIDLIIDRFEAARVLYRIEQVHGSVFDLVFLNSGRARKILWEESAREQQARSARLQAGIRRVFEEEFQGDAWEAGVGLLEELEEIIDNRYKEYDGE